MGCAKQSVAPCGQPRAEKSARRGAMVRDKTRPKPHRSERQYKWTRNYVLIFPIVPQSLSYLLEFPVCAQDDPDPESYFYGHTRD